MDAIFLVLYMQMHVVVALNLWVDIVVNLFLDFLVEFSIMSHLNLYL